MMKNLEYYMGFYYVCTILQCNTDKMDRTIWRV